MNLRRWKTLGAETIETEGGERIGRANDYRSAGQLVKVHNQTVDELEGAARNLLRAVDSWMRSDRNNWKRVMDAAADVYVVLGIAPPEATEEHR